MAILMQILNLTPFQTAASTLLDREGSQHWIVVIKASFTLQFAGTEGTCELAAEQEPVCLAPVFYGEPGLSSLVRESEMTLEHPGTDVILNGSAHAPEGRTAERLAVRLSVGALEKSLLISGERRWERRWNGLGPSAPEPFQRAAIVYENAYGGATPDAQCEPRNPIGRGFCTAPPDPGTLLPQVESPGEELSDWRQRPTPAGFGAISPGWSPRRELAGTFDRAWQETRLPLWPEDYQPEFQLSASPGLSSKSPLRGGEPVELFHLLPVPTISFRLPRVHLVVETDIGSSRYRQPTGLDRVIIEPDAGRVVLVWGSRLNCHNLAHRVRRSLVRFKPVLS